MPNNKEDEPATARTSSGNVGNVGDGNGHQSYLPKKKKKKIKHTGYKYKKKQQTRNSVTVDEQF